MRLLLSFCLFTGCGLDPVGSPPGTDDSGVTSDDVLIVGDLQMSPSTIDFGTVEFDTTETMDVTVSNIGSSVVSVSSIYLEGSLEYSVTYTSIPLVLDTEETAVVSVSFTPTAEQEYTGTLNLLITGESEIAAIDLVGFGSEDGSTTGPDDTGDTTEGSLTLSSSSIDFGEFDIDNGATTDSSITITNNSIDDILISDVSSTDSAFDGDVGQPIVLSSGSSTTLEASFDPTNEQEYSGTLTLETDDGETYDIAVSGSGADLCDICSGDITVWTGGTSDPYYTMDQFAANVTNNPDTQSLTIQNMGDMDLTISNITLINDTMSSSEIICGTDGTYSLTGNTSNVTIPAYDTLAVNVSFSYSGSGFIRGEVSFYPHSQENIIIIESDDPDESEYIIKLGGTYSLF